MFKRDYFISMDGRAIFQFAVRKVPEVIDELLEKNNLKKEEIAYYLLHQANRRIVEAVAKRMDQPIEKFPMNLDEYGNTSSASIPILLDEMNQKYAQRYEVFYDKFCSIDDGNASQRAVEAVFK